MSKWIALVATLASCYADAESIVIDDISDGEVREVVVPVGNIVEIRGLQLVVPDEIGAGVGAVAELRDGWIEVTVQNQGDGIVAIRTRGPDVANPTPPTAITDIGVANRNPACSEGAFKLEGHRWHSTLRWALSNANNPTAEMEAMVRLGAQNVVTSHNDCGLVDEVAATEQYLGRTTAASSASCSGADGHSVVGFGSLGGDFKAYTCWYWDSTNFLVEADIRFKVDIAWLTTETVPPGCVDQLHLESVATHEFGHAFGLLHPDGDHPVATMQPGDPCDASKSTLALGDVNALRKLY